MHPLIHITDLNTLDWGKNNILAIGLANSVFLWNANDGSVCELPNIGSESDYVSSVSWGGDGNYLAVGTSDSTIQVWFGFVFIFILFFGTTLISMFCSVAPFFFIPALSHSLLL